MDQQTIDGMVRDADRLWELYNAGIQTFTGTATEMIGDVCLHTKALADEVERLRTGLEMLAQTRHVSGSAQGTFRTNLKVADAVLFGADVRIIDEVEYIVQGKWTPEHSDDCIAQGDGDPLCLPSCQRYQWQKRG